MLERKLLAQDILQLKLISDGKEQGRFREEQMWSGTFLVHVKFAQNSCSEEMGNCEEGEME